MTPEELEEARLGFIHYLRRKRFSPQFIESHGEDLFATAALEYSRKLAEGSEIESPAGWLITCAWRRTKSLLEAEGRRPRVVSTDKVETIGDGGGKSPENLTLDEDRFRRVHEAVESLSEDEQRLLALAYFEDMPVREAARQLDWHPSKAQRCHEAARRRLHELLGVETLDELAIDVGLAAYLSVAGAGSPLQRLLEASGETLSRATASGWARTQELARRVAGGGGTDPGLSTTLGTGTGRAAGVCATAALACLASGVVGPGVGGVNLIGGEAGQSPPQRTRRVAEARAGAVTESARAAVVPTTPSPPAAKGTPKPEVERSSAGSTASASARNRQRASEAVRSQSLESAAGGPEEASPASTETASASYTPPPPESSSGGSAASPSQVANEQFGP